MQLKLGEDAEEKMKKLEQKRIEDEKEQEKEKMEREARKRYFEANFKYGSTTVMKYLGVFFFKGDIAHVGKDNIFYNSRKIKSKPSCWQSICMSFPSSGGKSGTMKPDTPDSAASVTNFSKP